jgi:hypothetical protein
VSTPENKEFHVDITFTGREPHTFLISAVVAAAAIIFIVATMTTNVAASLLPMSDEYLQAMVPVAADGAEPLGLTSLTHEIKDRTISVSGSIQNRTDFVISDVVAVVEMQDTTGRFPQTQEIPIMPPELAPKGMGTFMAMATLEQNPGGYLVKLRFAEGPFIPHKDERGPAITITPQITPQSIK